MSGIRRGERFGAGSQEISDQRPDDGLKLALGLKDPDAPQRLPIAKIRRDGGTQPRVQLDPATIQEYAEDMARGDVFPPGIVFDDGEHYWLARGFTRTASAESLGWTEFDYVVKSGTLRDAILFSLGENADHGLRRTNEDKRRAVLTMLNDPEWSQQSSSYIAKCCHVSHTFVENLRSLATVASQGEQAKKTRIGADGREYRVDRIQKKAQKRAARKSPTPAPEPARNLDESEPAGTWPDRPAQPRGVYRESQAQGDGWTATVRRQVDLSVEVESEIPQTPADIKRWVVDHLRAAGEGLARLEGYEGLAQEIGDFADGLEVDWGLVAQH